MKNTNRLLSILIAFLAIGVWGLLIRSFFSDYITTAQAQGRRQYAVAVITKDNKLAIGEDGWMALNATALQMAVDEIPRRGWRIHSVVYNGTAGGYVVVCEK